jgi:ABC-2 type transport system permease protein
VSNLFPNAGHVARREFLARVRSRSFVIVTAVLALVGVVLSLLPLGIELAAGDDDTTVAMYLADPSVPTTMATTLQDALNATAPAGDGTYVVSVVNAADDAQAEVRSGDLDGLLTVSRNGGGDLTFALYTDEGPTDSTQSALRGATYQLSVGDRLERAGVGAQAGEILAPAAFEVTRSDPDAVNPEEDFGARYLYAMALVILTFMAVITYGTWVASSVAEEKSSRVMELLITAATPRQLLAGKVLGTGAAGLTQYLAVVAAALSGLILQGILKERLLGEASAGQLEGLDLTVLAPFGVFFIGGFLLYATLYAGLGSMASRQEEVQQVTGPMIFVAMIGYFAAFIGLNTPDAAWMQVASLIPFFSPYLLPARAILDSVAPWEWIVAAALMLLVLAGALWVAARIYSAGVLLYGQRPSLRAMMRAVRVAR